MINYKEKMINTQQFRADVCITTSQNRLNMNVYRYDQQKEIPEWNKWDF